MANNPNKFNEEVGLLRKGWIDSYDIDRKILNVKLNNAPITSNNPAVPVPLPQTLFYNNGIYIGSLPLPGTPVVVGQGSGGQYFFVSFLAENLPTIPTLSLNELLIQANDITKMTMNAYSNDITLGSDADQLHINTEQHFISSNIDSEYNFTQATRRVNGAIKRDIAPNTIFSQNTKLENDDYEPYFYVIPMDPYTSPTTVVAGSNKNPPLVESREMIYEFLYD